MGTYIAGVNWHNPDEACAELRRLDARYKTERESPLSHDIRCPKCNPFLAEHFIVINVPLPSGAKRKETQ